MFLFGISNYEGGLDPLILLLMALVIETYAGQLGTVSRLNFHPLNALESLTVWFDLKLNRENRNQTDRAIRGGLTSLVIICMSGAVGWGIAWLSQALPFAWIFETILNFLSNHIDTYLEKCNTKFSKYSLDNFNSSNYLDTLRFQHSLCVDEFLEVKL